MERQVSVKFGTSGLRGLAEAFTAPVIAAYVEAFLTVCASGGSNVLCLGVDRRASSPRIAAGVIGAARRLGWEIVYAGVVPTPALAGASLAAGCPAIMVTGSHIPAQYNGIKFYRRDGELLKEDEAPVREAAEALLQQDGVIPAGSFPDPDPSIAAHYVSRFARFFASEALKGLRLGVYLHSAAGRQLLVEMLQALGAECLPFGESEDFIPIDTEALTPGFLDEARKMLAEQQLDAIVSTDGDGDRPLLIDETGTQINGDVLGALAAKVLNIQTAVTPLTSTSAVEQAGWFNHVVRTKVGSPFVITAMNALGPNQGSIAGFEANGGFLLGTDLEHNGKSLQALPTRDAVLPLLCVLAEAARSGEPVSKLRSRLPARFMSAARLEHVDQERSAAFIAQMQDSAERRAAFAPMLAEPQSTNSLDGYRMQLADGSVVHFRPSGNAPELRLYVETNDARDTEQMLEDLMARLKAHFSTADRS